MAAFKGSVNKEKFPPLIIHIIYFLAAVTFCFYYYLKVVKGASFSTPNSINAVLTFETFKPFQFRLLVPLIFKILNVFSFVPQKAMFMLYSVVMVYMIIVAYYYVLTEYFENNFVNMLFALFILYPMTWNYVLLNDTLQIYDFTSIFLFTLGLYFIIKDNYKALLIVFIIGLINKETIVYLIFAYMLFNYKSLFTKKIILNTIILGVIFIAIKVILYYIFLGNPGDPVEICINKNKYTVSTLFTSHLSAKNVFLNFGVLYLFALYLFISGRWKKFNTLDLKKKLFINLAIIPYTLLGIYITYIDEVRVYTELIPMYTTLFLILVSTFEKVPLEEKR